MPVLADPQSFASVLSWVGLAIGTIAYHLLIRRRAAERQQRALDEQAVLRSLVRHFVSD